MVLESAEGNLTETEVLQNELWQLFVASNPELQGDLDYWKRRADVSAHIPFITSEASGTFSYSVPGRDLSVLFYTPETDEITQVEGLNLDLDERILGRGGKIGTTYGTSRQRQVVGGAVVVGLMVPSPNQSWGVRILDRTSETNTPLAFSKAREMIDRLKANPPIVVE